MLEGREAFIHGPSRGMESQILLQVRGRTWDSPRWSDITGTDAVYSHCLTPEEEVNRS